MRFIKVMIPSVCQPEVLPGERAKAGDAPPAEAGARMMTFNEQLVRSRRAYRARRASPTFEGSPCRVFGGPP
jgi:hypothetical protein